MQLVKEVGEGGGREGAAETCLHSRVERMNDAIQHNFHSLLSACSVSLENPKGSVDFILVTSLSLSAECN